MKNIYYYIGLFILIISIVFLCFLIFNYIEYKKILTESIKIEGNVLEIQEINNYTFVLIEYLQDEKQNLCNITVNNSSYTKDEKVILLINKMNSKIQLEKDIIKQLILLLIIVVILVSVGFVLILNSKKIKHLINSGTIEIEDSF